MMLRLCSTLFATLLLSACASSPDDASTSAVGAPASGDHSCDSSQVQNLIGQKVTMESAEQARIKAGANYVRVLGPRDAVTLDYNSQRLNLELDGQARITRATCG